MHEISTTATLYQTTSSASHEINSSITSFHGQAGSSTRHKVGHSATSYQGVAGTFTLHKTSTNPTSYSGSAGTGVSQNFTTITKGYIPPEVLINWEINVALTPYVQPFTLSNYQPYTPLPPMSEILSRGTLWELDGTWWLDGIGTLSGFTPYYNTAAEAKISELLVDELIRNPGAIIDGTTITYTDGTIISYELRPA